jgi:hypothetical protein
MEVKVEVEVGSDNAARGEGPLILFEGLQVATEDDEDEVPCCCKEGVAIASAEEMAYSVVCVPGVCACPP